MLKEMAMANTTDAGTPPMRVVSSEPYRARGGRVPTQADRDRVRKLLARRVDLG